MDSEPFRTKNRPLFFKIKKTETLYFYGIPGFNREQLVAESN